MSFLTEAETVPGFNEAHKELLGDLLSLRDEFYKLTMEIYPDRWQRIVNSEPDGRIFHPVGRMGTDVERRFEDAINKIQKNEPLLRAGFRFKNLKDDYLKFEKALVEYKD